jgi:hypothetical protein
MAQAKREKIVYGDATEYKEDVKNGLIIPREPSKISDSLAEDVKKGRVVARPGQADTHLAHLSFTQEALLNGTATDKQEEIAKRYYVANIDAINADRKRHGLSPITVEEAVNAAKVVYEVLNNKGKESEELKKDVESGSVIYRRVNKDLEEEVLAKNVENVFITTTTTTTTRISTGPAAAPGGRGNGRVRRSTTEEAPAPETSGSTETTQNGGTPNKKNKGDQSSETVATELPHVAPDHGTTETGNAGEGARPSSGNGGSSVNPSQPEENKGGTEAPAPVQPPSQPEDTVVTPAPETNPAQPESPVENTPTPEPPHVETEEEKLAKYTENDFDGSTAGWYDVENPETYYQLLPADSDMRLEHGKTYRLVAWNTVTNSAEYVEVKHPKDLLSEHVHANSTDYAIRPQDKPVPGGPYKYILTIDWNTLNELDDNAQLHEYTSGLYYVSNEDLVPVFHHTKGLKWYDFDNVATTYDVDDSHETSYLTSEFKIDVRKTGTEEIVIYTMPILSEVFTQKVEYDGKTYWIRPQDNYTDEEHVKDIVMLDASKLNPALTNNIGAVNEAFTVVSNRVLHVETDEEKLAKYHQEDFSSSHMWYNLDNVHVMYTLHNDDLHKVIERGKTYKLAMWNTESNKAEFVEFKHIADVFTETVHANEIDYYVRPQDVYVAGDEGKDIVVYEKSSYDAMPDQTLETMVGIVYQSHTANLAPTVYTYDNGFKWYDLNDPSHVYLVPDTYAYNNLLENLEITVKDTATDSEIKMTIPNPNTVFTEEVEYNGETYVIRPQDIYFEGGTEKNVVITKKSMIIGFAVYMQSVLINTVVISNKTLANTESASTTEDPVVNGKKLSEYTEAEFDSATTYFDLETPADVNGTLYTLRADADKPFDLNTAYDLVMMEAASKKVKLVHIDPILTTFTHEVKTESELDIMLRPQDAYVNGVTRDVVYIDKAVKDEARTVATFMHYVSTDSMTNLKPYEAPSNSEITPGTSEATPTPAPEEADPIIHGKKLSEYNSTNFNRSYVYVNYNEDMSSNNYNDFSYFLTLDAINTPLERGKTYDFAMMNVNTNQIKVIHMDDPYATFTKESKTVSRSNILLRPQDEYVKGDERYIPFLIKETFDTASTIGDYCNALAVEPSDSLKPDISENYFTDHEFHITSVQSEGYCVAKGDESTIPVPGHTYHLYNISTQEAEDVVFPDIKNTYDTVNIGRQKYYYNPEYKVTDPHAIDGEADMYAYLGETIDNTNSTWLDIMISQRRVPRMTTYIEPKLPEVTDTIDTTVYYDKPWFSMVPYDLSTRLYIRRDSISEHPAPQYDKVNIFTVWNAKTNAESKEYISHLGSNVFGPFDVKGESCYVFKASDDYSTVNNLEDLGVGRNIVTIPARIMEKININDYQSITWKDILDNVKLIYTGDLY